MVGPRWFVGFDSLMEFVAFIIAVAIAYQAFKGYRLTKQKTLLYVHFSFAALSTGLLVDSLTGFLAILARALKGFVVPVAPVSASIRAFSGLISMAWLYSERLQNCAFATFR